MDNKKQIISWVLRILIAILFLVSAFAKTFPSWAAFGEMKPSVWMFEKQLVDLGITGWCASHYMARALIALELAIAFAVLQRNYLRSIVIPGTILLLVLFNIHLSIEMYKHGAMNGNCGCFGQLLPMTPLEAFIKNVILMAMLVYLFLKVSDKEKGENRFIYPFSWFLGSLVLMFTIAPFAPCSPTKAAIVEMPSTENFVLDTTHSETITLPGSDSLPASKLNEVKKIDTVKGQPANVSGSDAKSKLNATAQPVKTASVKSKFAPFTQFGKTTVNLDQGKKIVCMFAPGCEHCRKTATEIGEMAKQPGFPEVYILFMDEEANLIPEFFTVTKTNFPYQVLDIPTFWDTMGIGATTPGVYYLQDGKIIKSYQGIEQDEFKPKEFKSILGLK